jgi:heme/copper-type cytochrome/quinol oxidase subunit 2
MNYLHQFANYHLIGHLKFKIHHDTVIIIIIIIFIIIIIIIIFVIIIQVFINQDLYSTIPIDNLKFYYLIK